MMKKGLILAAVLLLVLAAAVPAAGALTEKQKDELAKLYEEEHQLRLQIVEKQREAGLLSEENAQLLKERLQEQWQCRRQRMQEGDYSFGQYRCGGRGRGQGRGCGGYGAYNQRRHAARPEQSA
ncbi:MAG: DUF2680 domain-containing protein [Firmicutes bacterium]|jgi:hypothetical protein|nr:DUF2680 domain-containing protein [Bacillota bacterium]